MVEWKTGYIGQVPPIDSWKETRMKDNFLLVEYEQNLYEMFLLKQGSSSIAEYSTKFIDLTIRIICLESSNIKDWTTCRSSIGDAEVQGEELLGNLSASPKIGEKHDSNIFQEGGISSQGVHFLSIFIGCTSGVL